MTTHRQTEHRRATLAVPTVVTALAAAAFAAAVPPDIGALRTAWSAPGARVDAIASVLAMSALWCLAVWVLFAVGLALIARIPGRTGRIAAIGVRVTVPRLLRAALVGSLASGLTLGTAATATASTISSASTSTAPPASFGTTDPPVSPPSWPTDTPTSPPSWPTDPGSPVAPTPTQPAQPSQPSAPSGSTAAAGSPVTVVPGDSLWSITAARWRSAHGTDPTDAQVVAAWPLWYAANRTAIGPDPGLIRPGQVLQAPPAGPTGAPTDPSTATDTPPAPANGAR